MPHWALGDVRMFQFDTSQNLKKSSKLVLKHQPDVIISAVEIDIQTGANFTVYYL